MEMSPIRLKTGRLLNFTSPSPTSLKFQDKNEGSPNFNNIRIQKTKERVCVHSEDEQPFLSDSEGGPQVISNRPTKHPTTKKKFQEQELQQLMNGSSNKKPRPGYFMEKTPKYADREIMSGHQQMDTNSGSKIKRGKRKKNKNMSPQQIAFLEKEKNLDSIRKRKITCNCKKSRCLKLYCECYAAGDYCLNCNCNDCANIEENGEERYAKMESLMERNPNAFKQKILFKENLANIENVDDFESKHARGCHCKKSNCMKKYCECFQSKVKCTPLCKCDNCNNKPF